MITFNYSEVEIKIMLRIHAKYPSVQWFQWNDRIQAVFATYSFYEKYIQSRSLCYKYYIKHN